MIEFHRYVRSRPQCDLDLAANRFKYRGRTRKKTEKNRERLTFAVRKFAGPLSVGLTDAVRSTDKPVAVQTRVADSLMVRERTAVAHAVRDLTRMITAASYNAIVHIRLLPGSMLPPGESLRAYILASPVPQSPLLENLTSSTKPEVRNVLQRRQKRTEPRPRAVCIGNSV